MSQSLLDENGHENTTLVDYLPLPTTGLRQLLVQRHYRSHLPKENAYKALVRPLVEYASPVWDPYHQNEIDRLEMVQRRGARYVTNRHGNRSSVNDMLQHLDWTSLENRRKYARLALFYKIENEKVAICKEGRLIRPRRTTRNMHTKSYQLPATGSDYRKHSFFPRTIRDWNALPPGIVSAPSLEVFKASVTKHQI